MGFGRRKTFKVVDAQGLPLWWRAPAGDGFYRSMGGSWTFRTPLDRLLGRSGSEVLSCGVSFRPSLPPGTPLRGALGGFGGLVGADGVGVVFDPGTAVPGRLA